MLEDDCRLDRLRQAASQKKMVRSLKLDWVPRSDQVEGLRSAETVRQQPRTGLNHQLEVRVRCCLIPSCSPPQSIMRSDAANEVHKARRVLEMLTSLINSGTCTV